MIALLLIMAQASAPTPSELGYMNCLFKQGEALDDGSSDAKTVGHALAEVCAKEQRAMGEEAFSSKNLSTEARAEAIRRFQEKGDDMATHFVLSVRAAGRSSKN